MPEIKISEFPELNTPILTDVISILDLSETDSSLINKKVSIEDALNLVPTPEVISASNLGLGAFLFKQKDDLNFKFKFITAGASINVTNNTDDINITYQYLLKLDASEV